MYIKKKHKIFFRFSYRAAMISEGPTSALYSCRAHCMPGLVDAEYLVTQVMGSGRRSGGPAPRGYGFRSGGWSAVTVLRDYRGEQVRLPEEAAPGVLARLAGAAARQGRMPDQDPTPAPIYLALRDSLRQFVPS